MESHREDIVVCKPPTEDVYRDGSNSEEVEEEKGQWVRGLVLQEECERRVLDGRKWEMWRLPA